MKLVEALQKNFTPGQFVTPTAIAHNILSPDDSTVQHEHLMLAQVDDRSQPITEATEVAMVILCRHHGVESTGHQTVAYWQTVYPDLEWSRV